MTKRTETGTLIAATTLAVALGDADDIDVPQGHFATVVATNLAGVEEVDIYTRNLNGTTTVVYESDAPVKLTATNPQVQLKGPCSYAFAKDATAGACAVEVRL